MQNYTEYGLESKISYLLVIYLSQIINALIKILEMTWVLVKLNIFETINRQRVFENSTPNLISSTASAVYYAQVQLWKSSHPVQDFAWKYNTEKNFMTVMESIDDIFKNCTYSLDIFVDG